MLKLSENPPVLFPDQESLADLSGRWWVAHTKSRFEKAFAWDLLSREIGYFLPMIERVLISGGRKRRVMAPLFPSYVFFCGNEEHRYAAMTTNRLCQTMEVHDQETFLDDLVAIERALAGETQLDLYPFAAIGQSCRITAGPFQGMKGVVVRRNQRNNRVRFVLQVSILGQGAALDVDADLLEAVE